MAFSTKQKSKKITKGERTSQDPNSLCHLPLQHLLMHSDTECRTQNSSLASLRPNGNPRPMGRATSAPAPSGPQGLSEISALTDTEKEQLFDDLQTACDNTFVSTARVTAASSPAQNDNGDNFVDSANAYSEIAQSKTKKNDMVLDLGADIFIFDSIQCFVNMNPIKIVGIKADDCICHIEGNHCGDVLVESYEENGAAQSTILSETQYCPDISINLIPSSCLCNNVTNFTGVSERNTMTRGKPLQEKS